MPLPAAALLLTGLLYSGNGRAMPSDYRTTMIEESPKNRRNSKAARSRRRWMATGGYRFSRRASAPIGNATPEYLAKFQAYYIGEPAIRKRKKIYLTFDAGYENGVTEKPLTC